jgi:aryl sulfotransferase
VDASDCCAFALSRREFPGATGAMSPWLDMRIIPLEGILNNLKAQQHRRFIKTHLPLDGVPYSEKIKYLYIARDPVTFSCRCGITMPV